MAIAARLLRGESLELVCEAPIKVCQAARSHAHTPQFGALLARLGEIFKRITMKLLRRQFLLLAASTLALPVVSRIARAKTYPTRPVRLIVAVAAGGPTDIIARLMGQWLSERLGQQFIIDNRPGGGSNIGTEAVVRAPPDGHTLLMVNTANVVGATFYDKLNYNFTRDIAPVAGITRTTFVMVANLSVPAKTVPEFIAYARANPGKISMASAGTGSGTHITGELFKMMTGVNMPHVPYRGGGPALVDLLGGQVQVMFDPIPTWIEYIKAGKVRALAVTSTMRPESLPDIPTMSDFLPGFESSTWFGVGAPRTTPPEIINTLNQEINAALADPKFKARLADLGGVPMSMTPSEFGIFIANETEKWGKVVRNLGIKAE